MDVLNAEAGGKQGNLDFLLQFVVHGHTELGFKVAAEAVHELFHFVHFAHHQFVLRAVRDVEQHFLGVEDIVVVEQRRVLGILDGHAHAVVSLAVAGTHDGHAAVFQYGFHIVEVEVDLSVQGNDFGNALGGYREGVVGFVESIVYGEFAIYFAQFFVVDNQQGIYMLADFLHAVQCLVYLLVALPAERDSDDADSQDVHFFGGLCNDRRCTCTCATAHSGSDEYHFSTVVQHGLDVFDALFGCLAGTGRTVSGSQTLFAKLQLHRNGGVFQRLVVCVAQHERYIMYAFPVHVVYGIAATATHTDNFDDFR